MGISPQDKFREKASRLKNPTPKELPSGMWRCQVMVNSKRVGFTDRDPGVAYAKAVAYRERVLLEAEQPKANLTLECAIDQYIQNRDSVLSPSTINGYQEIRRNRFPTLMKEKVLNLEKPSFKPPSRQRPNRWASRPLKTSLAWCPASSANTTR